MLKLSQEQKNQFAEAVRAAADSPLIAEIDLIYADFEAARQHRQPICRQSGACCRFEEHGHRLFVTVLEVAHFRRNLGRANAAEGVPWDGTGCPYQIQGLCSVHSARPFGCRVYFCDPTSTQWQNDHYERLHSRIRELHSRAGVPYLYVEWREALDAVGLSPEVRAAGRRLPVSRG